MMTVVEHVHSSNGPAIDSFVQNITHCPSQGSEEKVFFFDIDNCLYDIASGISDMMAKKISDYGEQIGIPKESVFETTFGYYKKYGLAIRGFIMHHDIDPTHFDLNVDQSLPLEDILKPDLKLRKMLTNLKMRRWAFTNANRPHAEKVLRLLGISDLFEGLTFCDYSLPGFSCKPELDSYVRAMNDAKVSRPDLCYFIDDSPKNVIAARDLGWNAVLVAGSTGSVPSSGVDSNGIRVVHTVTDLPSVLPEFF